MGQNRDAAAEIGRANQLDPLNLMANAELGWIAYFDRRFDDAIAACRKTLQQDSNNVFALTCLQCSLTLKGDPEAVSVGKKLLALTGRDPYFLGNLGWAYGLQGRTKEAEKILAELRALGRKSPLSPSPVLSVALGLRDFDTAMDQFEAAYAGRWPDVVWIRAEPAYDSLRSDPRFQSLLKKMKLDN